MNCWIFKDAPSLRMHEFNTWRHKRKRIGYEGERAWYLDITGKLDWWIQISLPNRDSAMPREFFFLNRRLMLGLLWIFKINVWFIQYFHLCLINARLARVCFAHVGCSCCKHSVNLKCWLLWNFDPLFILDGSSSKHHTIFKNLFITSEKSILAQLVATGKNKSIYDIILYAWDFHSYFI